jgi:hypothetical protein
MRKSAALCAAATLLAAGLTGVLTSAPAQAAGDTRQIPRAGTTSISSSALGGDGAAVQDPEFPGETDADAANAGGADPNPGIVDRSLSGGHAAKGVSTTSGRKAKSNPEVVRSFDGLNFRQQRLANGGNQFSVEPPDQGLCAGNGYVLESVNDVLRVFDTSGAALTGVVDLNSFYGYAPAINRSTGVRGPFVTDPTCYFDPDTQRFYHVVLTLDTLSNGAFTGTNHLDIAVSNGSSPLGTWTVYRLPVQDNGTQGTPNHGCSLGPCLGDYPHVGADATGFYITTNEYSFFGPEFKSAQIYAFSKRELASLAASVTVTQIDTTGADNGNPGFTVWPAQSPAGQASLSRGGTEYFLSSNAAEEANGSGASSEVLLWSLSNTASLDTASATPSLQHIALPVGRYAIPPKSDQQSGDFPLGQCINDTTTVITSLGPPFTGCWRALFGTEPAHDEVISHLDSNDTRMQQVVYANGKVWGALDTALTVGGVNKAGIEYFIAKPSTDALGNVVGTAKSGYLGLANNNLTYPAVGVTASGRGVMAFTVVGADYHPSAGYAPLDAIVGAGDVHVVADGVGVDDGFTSYKAFVGNPPRTRWGDYGATAIVGNTIWMASEYIAQTCTLAQYVSPPFGSCGGTRASLGNWATRLSLVKP